MQKIIRPNVSMPSAGEMQSAFFSYAAQNNLVGIARLLEAGINIDSTDPKGQTALHIATANGAHTIAEYLIRKGIDIHREDKERNTALSIAIRMGNLESHQTLYCAGAESFNDQIRVQVGHLPTTWRMKEIKSPYSIPNTFVTVVCVDLSLDACANNAAAPEAVWACRGAAFHALDQLRCIYNMHKVDAVGTVYIAATEPARDSSAASHAARAARFAADAAATTAVSDRSAIVRVGIHSAVVPPARAGASLRYAHRSWLADAARASLSLARTAGPRQVRCCALCTVLVAEAAPVPLDPSVEPQASAVPDSNGKLPDVAAAREGPDRDGRSVCGWRAGAVVQLAGCCESRPGVREAEDASDSLGVPPSPAPPGPNATDFEPGTS